MRLSRTGGVIAACAIHGLLFAVVPTELAATLSSGGGERKTMSLSIAYQSPVSVMSSQAEPIEEATTTEPKPIVESKPKAAAKIPVKQIVQPVEQAIEEPTPELAMAEPAPQPETSAAGGHQGMHQTIITEPLFASQPQPPVYPRIARKRGQQGTVWIDVLLDKTGQQTHVEIFQSSGVSPLDRAALKAVKQWQFIAHHIDDIAVASHIRIPVEFSLD